jgi:hypothetical protein
MVTLHPKSSRTGKTLTRVAVSLGLVGACTVVDKGEYTFTDNPDATGGEDSGGGTGGAQGGSSGNSGTTGMAGEGGEMTGGSGGNNGGTGGGTSGDGGGGTGGAGDGCDPNPCQNGGDCTVSGNSFTCDCADGWEGETCEDDVDECEPNPCKNGAQCNNMPGDFSCDCPMNVTGKTCELLRFEPIEVGPRSYAKAVSADGTRVLGAHFNVDGMERPYFWTTEGGPTTLTAPSELRTSHVTPHAITGNGDYWVGQVLETSATGAQPKPAGGTPTQFAPFGMPMNSLGAAIVDADTTGAKFVGWVDDGTAIGVHAFTWDNGGRPMPLPPPMVAMMSQYFVAGAVTRDGQIVTGSAQEPMGGNWYVVGWGDPGGPPPPPFVSAPAGTTAVAVHGVSADGLRSVGTFRDPAIPTLAFVTDQTRFHNIAPMVGANRVPSNAWDVSDDGATVVGDMDASGMGTTGSQAVIWIGPPPAMHQLIEVMLRNLNVDLRGCSLKAAYGVSADGKVVVGQATNMGGAMIGFIARL